MRSVADTNSPPAQAGADPCAAPRVRIAGRLLLALPLLLAAPWAPAQVSVGVGISVPGISIGLDMPAYPELVPVPGYPVYYAPRASANYFFYDGQYWVFRQNNWYAGTWYNGPWRLVGPEFVPVYVLRVPVRYYRQPPPYFRGWVYDAPPRWGEHWGHDWEVRRRGWDHWDRRAVPMPAPLPAYQRDYAGDRYPREAEQQRTIRAAHYKHPSRDGGPQGQDASPRADAARPGETGPDQHAAAAAPQDAKPRRAARPPHGEPAAAEHESNRPPQDGKPPPRENKSASRDHADHKDRDRNGG